MSTAVGTDWTETYEELQTTLKERFRSVDREMEDFAWRVIKPLSTQTWAMVREKLTVDNHEELAKQAYCVAMQAVMYHLERMDEDKLGH